MKKFMERTNIERLNKKVSRSKYVSILLALFTLGVNIFAWFAFSANVGVQLDANVASWDVDFSDGNGVITRNVTVTVTDMKPGMSDFVETIVVENNSNINTVFSYELDSFSLLGTTYDLDNIADPIDYIRNTYPFSITMLASKNKMSAFDSLSFDISVIWPFELATPRYFTQDFIYNYDDGFIYYKLIDESYEEYTVANATAYASEKSSLYLEKDDADSYFGMACGAYESSTGEPCLTMNLRLLVAQDEEEEDVVTP